MSFFKTEQIQRQMGNKKDIDKVSEKNIFLASSTQTHSLLFLENLKIEYYTADRTWINRVCMHFWWSLEGNLVLVHTMKSNPGSGQNERHFAFSLVRRTCFTCMQLSVKVRLCWTNMYPCRFKCIFLLGIFHATWLHVRETMHFSVCSYLTFWDMLSPYPRTLLHQKQEFLTKLARWSA